MNETYCGKDCQTCSYRVETGCGGCLEQASRECRQARCCQEKGNTTCASCTYNPQCGLYQGKDMVPQYRLAKKKADLEHQALFKQRGAFLAQWIWVLFWLCIPQTAAVIMQWLLGLGMAGSILNLVCTVAYGGVLLKISLQEREYRTAGVLTLTVEGVSLVAFVTRQTFLMVVLIIVIMIMSRCYHEFNAHAHVLEEVDDKLSQQWRKLWTWKLRGSIAIVVGVVFLLFPVGLTMIGIGAIIILATNFLKLVWLLRTARAFQKMAVS